MRKIAIIGRCSNTRADAPVLVDPSWEVWGLAWDLLPACHRYFEMHSYWRHFRSNADDALEHWRFLCGLDVPVYMRKTEPDVPQSRAFPFREISKVIGRPNGWDGDDPYCESSIGFMLGLAIYEAVTLKDIAKIGIWGVDMGTDGEYYYQRPNMEYLIGFARGAGIKVFVPPQSALLKPAKTVPYGLWKAAEDENWVPPENWPVPEPQAA